MREDGLHPAPRAARAVRRLQLIRVFDGREPMRITRELTREDLVTLRAYLKTRPEAKVVRRADYLGYFLCASFIGFGILAIPLARWTVAAPIWFLASPFVGIAIWHPLWLYLDRRALVRFVSANKLELGPQEFWVSDDGFGNSTVAGSTFHKWRAVVAVDNTAAQGFVAAGVHIYAIPYAGHREEVMSFVVEMKKRWEAAKSGAVEQ